MKQKVVDAVQTVSTTVGATVVAVVATALLRPSITTLVLYCVFVLVMYSFPTKTGIKIPDGPKGPRLQQMFETIKRYYGLPAEVALATNPDTWAEASWRPRQTTVLLGRRWAVFAEQGTEDEQLQAQAIIAHELGHAAQTCYPRPFVRVLFPVLFGWIAGSAVAYNVPFGLFAGPTAAAVVSTLTLVYYFYRCRVGEYDADLRAAGCLGVDAYVKGLTSGCGWLQLSSNDKVAVRHSVFDTHPTMHERVRALLGKDTWKIDNAPAVLPDTQDSGVNR